MSFRLSCYVATKPFNQPNQDAHVLFRQMGQTGLAVLDGAGNAEKCAGKLSRQLSLMLAASDIKDFRELDNWRTWARALDLAARGTNGSTFVGGAYDGDDCFFGVSVGDSRIFQVRGGTVTQRNADSPKQLLGSGRVQPCGFTFPLSKGDVILLMTDGAWKPLSYGTIGSVVLQAGQTFREDELPMRLLVKALQHGQDDDMTIVAGFVKET